MRPERLYLADIIEAAANIGTHIAGRSREAVIADPTARAAVAHELTVIGEAASRISAATRERHGHVPWADIVAFRNIIVHAYFGVSWALVWDTATRDVPELAAQVDAILKAEYP